jgi:hypothetical protein
MNTLVTKYGLLALGALIGGATGYILAKHYLEKAAEEKATQLEFDFNKPVNQVVDGNEPGAGTELAKTIVEQALASDKPGVNWDGTPVESEYDGEKVVVTDEKTLKKKKKMGPVTDYNSLSKKPLKEVAKEHHILEEATEETVSNQDQTVPYVITLEEYAIQNGQEKVVLTYYEKDDIVCDESEKVVSDTDKLIGSDGLLKFGQWSGDPDSVYIRNLKMNIDFEVVRLKKSYTEEILGVEPEEKKRPARKTTKTKKVLDDEQHEDEQ